MTPKFRHVDRDYSPAEVAKITGVSTTLQRDWRRREILLGREKPGWSRFGFHDIVEIFILKWFSAAGSFVKQRMDTIRFASPMASKTIWRQLMKLDGAVEIHSDLPEVQKYAYDLLDPRERDTTPIRYLVILPCYREDESYVERVRFTEDLNSIDEKIEEFGSIGFTALDLLKIGDLIVERGGLPVTRVEADE